MKDYKMNSHNQPSNNLYALLIGIDRYLPNLLPDDTYYLNLKGCVRDIKNVEKFLLDRLALPAERIFTFTSSDTGTEEISEPPQQWPTKKNIVAAFKKLHEIAQPGDQVYIHYSGHGGRVRTPTQFQDIKGGDGFDEVLVPMDISNTEDHYIRDLELAHLLRLLVDKQLVVTVVLDSCHSGSATRGLNPASVRSIGVVNTVFPHTPTVVASDEELAATWSSLSKTGERAFTNGSGWLLEPQGYVLLSACRASEYAHEFPFNGQQKNGVLTYWLLDTFKQLDQRLTYKAVYDRVLAKVHSQFADQTPQLQGERNRVVFGSDLVEAHDTAVVLSVAPDPEAVMLNAGQSQGVSVGARFAIYRNREEDFTREDKRVALAEIIELGATSSRAKVIKRFTTEPIAEGDQAVLVDVGQQRLRHRVHLSQPLGGQSSAEAITALAEVERILKQGQGGFLEPASEIGAADFIVTVNTFNQLVICGPSGEEISNLRPSLRVEDLNAPTRTIERLTHLAKYRNVLGLDNWDRSSDLAHALSVEMIGVQTDFIPGEKPSPKLFTESPPSVKSGDWVFLRIENKHTQVLNVTVLNLQPDWAIRQIYPSGAAKYEPLDPGQVIQLSLRAGLPSLYQEGTEVLKVFATAGTSNFRWLELPSLDNPQQSSQALRGAPSDPLEELLSAMMLQGDGLRQLTLAAQASSEWSVAQVEVIVQK
jgi:hypothetical protein